jgi:hypothetical protein
VTFTTHPQQEQVVRAIKGEVFTVLSNYVLAMMLVHSSSEGLSERLRDTHDTWTALAAAALQDPSDVTALTAAGTALAQHLAPDLDEATAREAGGVLAALASAQGSFALDGEA